MVNCSLFLVFVTPMSTYHKTIVIIIKDLVGETFIVHVISSLNCMKIWYTASVFIIMVLPQI